MVFGTRALLIITGPSRTQGASPRRGSVGWSDRMISFYTSVWLFAALWYPFRRKVKTLSWIGFILLLLPLIMDGGTHMLSDFAGIGQGFRDTNQWLVILTNNSFSATFYAGDALGSFNSLMRSDQATFQPMF